MFPFTFCVVRLFFVCVALSSYCVLSYVGGTASKNQPQQLILKYFPARADLAANLRVHGNESTSTSNILEEVQYVKGFLDFHGSDEGTLSKKAEYKRAMFDGAIDLVDAEYFYCIQSTKIFLVLYYTPWCYWSREVLPEFDAAARILAHDAGDEVYLFRVDCEKNENIARKENIDEYPTIKFHIYGKSKEYTGDRNRLEIVNWVNKQLNRTLQIKTIEQLEELLSNLHHGHVVAIAALHSIPKSISSLEDKQTNDSFSTKEIVSEIKDKESAQDGDELDKITRPDKILKDTFSEISRTLGDEIFFGEVSNHELLMHVMDNYRISPFAESEKVITPFLLAFSPHKEDLPYKYYQGDLNNVKMVTRFLRTYKFKVLSRFSNILAQKIFSDGRALCVLFIDTYSKEFKKSPTQNIIHSFRASAEKYRTEIIFAVSGNKEPHERRLLNLLGIEEENKYPLMRILQLESWDDNGTRVDLKFRPHAILEKILAEVTTSEIPAKRMFENLDEVLAFSEVAEKGENISSKTDTATDISAELENEINNFLGDFLTKKLVPYWRSEPIPLPEENAGPLKVLVGTNFESEVILSNRDVLVSFAAPWCGHCRKLEPELKKLAWALKGESDILVAIMDATRNEVKDFVFTSFPTMLLFPVGRKEDPLNFEEERNAQEILLWLSKNTPKRRFNLAKVMMKLGGKYRGQENEHGNESTKHNKAFEEL